MESRGTNLDVCLMCAEKKLVQGVDVSELLTLAYSLIRHKCKDYPVCLPSVFIFDVLGGCIVARGIRGVVIDEDKMEELVSG